MHLDELDVALLRALLEDARASNREVARKVGSSPTTVGQRLKRLEEAGLIAGSSLRLVPQALPGRNRLLQGSVEPERTQDVLEAARSLPGVVEAAVTPEGRLVVLLVVAGLEEEDEVTDRLQRAGAKELGVVGVRRVSGPPPLHLFRAPGGFEEVCAQCGKRVEEPLEKVIEGRRVVFCCPSCQRLYLERYQRLARRARGEG